LQNPDGLFFTASALDDGKPVSKGWSVILLLLTRSPIVARFSLFCAAMLMLTAFVGCSNEPSEEELKKGAEAMEQQEKAMPELLPAKVD